MKNIIAIAAFSLILVACGGESENVSSGDSKKIMGCDLLTDTFIKSTFSQISDLKKNNRSSDRSCAYTFIIQDESYNVSLTLLAAKDPYVDEAVFDKKASYIVGNTLINGVGEKAYFSKQMSTLTAFGNRSIVQVSLGVPNSKPENTNQVMAKKVAIGLLNTLGK